jgi:HD-like signal output (HDOD) protein
LGELGLDDWIDRLSKEEMPIFARTAQLITGIASRDNSSFSELARGILQDASMTSRILKLSNSIYYSPSYKGINTISRAVMVLGFDAVYAMSLSFSLIESLPKGAHKERVAREMARSFHAAVQAKKLAILKKDKSPEEVFIAAFLYRLGHIAFWCFGGKLADQLDAAMRKPGITEAQAEQQVLGFRLQNLTKELCKEWRLGPLLENALDSSSGSNPRTNSILWGYNIAVAVEQSGWRNSKVKSLIKKSAEYLKMAEDAVEKIVHGNAKDAAQIAINYGMFSSSRLIPLPDDQTPVEAERLPDIAEFPEPDRILQLKILRELSALLLERKVDVNVLFSVLLEGIFRGIGMDRVLFALLTRDRRLLNGRYGLGWAKEDTVRNFTMPAKGGVPNIFTHVLETLESIWVTDKPPRDILRLLTPDIRRLSDSSPFFIMPISPRNISIGVIYADRQPSGRELNEESFASFKFFGQQANLCLAALSK